MRDRILVGAGAVTGFVLGLFGRVFVRRVLDRRPPVMGYDSDVDVDDNGGSCAHKLILCVRTDLKMQKGKIAAQAGHATLGAYRKASRSSPAALRSWEASAQPKIALQIRSLAEARLLEANAKRLGLVTYMVYDAGRTQIAAVRLLDFMHYDTLFMHYGKAVVQTWHGRVSRFTNPSLFVFNHNSSP